MTKYIAASHEALSKKRGAMAAETTMTPASIGRNDKTTVAVRKDRIPRNENRNHGLQVSVPTPLNGGKQSRLKKCEAVIARGFDSFYEMGHAFIQIRDEKLFAGEYKSFEDYLKVKWDVTRQRGSQVIRAAQCHAKLAGSVGEASLPTTERAMRELLKAPEEKRARIVQLAAKTGEPTTSAIIDARVEVLGPINTNKRVKLETVITLDRALEAFATATRFLKGFRPAELGKGARTKIQKAYAKLAARFAKTPLHI